MLGIIPSTGARPCGGRWQWQVAATAIWQVVAIAASAIPGGSHHIGISLYAPFTQIAPNARLIDMRVVRHLDFS